MAVRLFSSEYADLITDQGLLDLAMDRMLHCIFSNREIHALRRFFKAAPSIDDINKRQEFFRTVFQNEQELTYLRTIQSHAGELQKLSAVYSNDRHATPLFWLRYTQRYCAAVNELATYALDHTKPHSALFLSVYQHFKNEYRSAEYTALLSALNETQRTFQPFGNTVLWLQVSNTAYTSCAVYPQDTVASFSETVNTVIEQLFGDSFNETPSFSALQETDHYLDFLADHTPALSSSLQALYNQARHYVFSDLSTLATDIHVLWDIQTLLHFLNEKRIPLCEAQIHETPYFKIQDGMDISLLDRTENIVPNSLCEHRKTVFLHGANSGGKTAFLRMIGICTIFAVQGLPAPCKRLSIPHITKIRTVFTQTESLSKGRLAAENDRLQEALCDITPQTLLCINEVFSSTSAHEASLLTDEILRFLAQNDVWCLWNTHHVLPQISDTSEAALYAPLVDENGDRRYIIQECKDTSSRAGDIAHRYGLQKDAILAVWHSRL